jgi:mannitol-specific phosphotransferase system IIBC component
MKKSDIAMILLIASASALIAYFVASAIFGGISNSSVKVKTIDPINSTIVEPDSSIFNKNAINPAVEVQIGSSQTQSGSQ